MPTQLPAETIRDSTEIAPPRPIPGTISVAVPIILRPEDDGGYSAEIPALPGCVSGGETLDETLANLQEAAEGWLLAKHEIETKGWEGVNHDLPKGI